MLQNFQHCRGSVFWGAGRWRKGCILADVSPQWGSEENKRVERRWKCMFNERKKHDFWTQRHFSLLLCHSTPLPPFCVTACETPPSTENDTVCRCTLIHARVCWLTLHARPLLGDKLSWTNLSVPSAPPPKKLGGSRVGKVESTASRSLRKVWIRFCLRIMMD